MRKLILTFVLGIFVGVVCANILVTFFTPSMFVEGIVKYIPPNNTAASAALPEGFMVESIIYIQNLTKEDVGKQKSFWGQLGSIPDSDHYRYYPKLFKIRKK